MFDSIYIKAILGIVIGAALGVTWSRLTRCSTGACPLTGTWWTAGLIGALFGLILAITPGGGASRAASAGTQEKVDANQPAPADAVVPRQGDKAMPKQVQSVAQFENEVLQAPRPVLVDFSATWCGPCRLLAPVMDQLAAELAGRADVAKVDVDTVPDLAARYQIQSVPTVILFNGGKPTKSFVGVRSRSDYLNAVQQTAGAR